MRPAEPPSNQMALPGMGSEGEALMDEARRWVAAHYDEWQFWCATARRDGDETGYISSDAVTHMMRHRFRIEVKNAYTPAFARIFLERLKPAEREIYRPCFRMGRSKVDMYTEVAL